MLFSFLTAKTAAPKPQAGHLHAEAGSAVVRWLLDPVIELPADLRVALLNDLDLSLSGAVLSLVHFDVLNLICCHLAGGLPFAILLVLNLLLGPARIATSVFVMSGRGRDRRWATDVYVFTTLLWCLVQGVLSGAAEYSGIPAVQTIAAAWVLSMHGPLCARNYPSPRFARAILLALDIPLIIGDTFAANHWLIFIGLATPGYLYANFDSILRFQKISVETMRGHLESYRQARRDALTGALNRFGLMETLEEATLPARVSLFCLDLDGFKGVNDQLGHHAGDSVLQMSAARLRRVSRESDIVARPGGDEFVIIAPNMPPAASEVFAARLVDEICGELYVLEDGHTAKIGVSVGFACVPEDGGTLDDIYRKADAALYVVKEQGKSHWRRFAAAA